MKILTVGYRRLETTGNYNNVACEATAEVGADETPGQAMVELQSFVDAHVKLLILAERGSDAAQNDLRNTEYKLQRARQRLEEMEALYQQGKEFLAKHNVMLPDYPYSARTIFDDQDPFYDE